MMLETFRDGNQLTIRLPEIFGFMLRREFKEATSGSLTGVKYILDFREVIKVDSSALGMLLIFREAAGGEKAEITFTNVNTEIRQLLKLANFEQLFKFK